MQVLHVVLFVLLSIHVQTNYRDMLRPYATFQEQFCADHSLWFWFSSTHHVLCDTLFDAMIGHAQHPRD